MGEFKAYTIEELRSMYPIGIKLRLTKPIDDKYSSKKAGDILTVSYIDDIGQIHGSWSCGGNIAIIMGYDEFEIVE